MYYPEDKFVPLPQNKKHITIIFNNVVRVLKDFFCNILNIKVKGK